MPSGPLRTSAPTRAAHQAASWPIAVGADGKGSGRWYGFKRRVGECAEFVALDVGKRDLFALFDFRRYEERTLALAREVTSRGARVVLFTDRWLSPVAGLAEVVLPGRVDSPSPYDSFVPALALVETLVAALIDRLGPAAGGRLKAMEAAQQAFGGA